MISGVLPAAVACAHLARFPQHTKALKAMRENCSMEYCPMGPSRAERIEEGVSSADMVPCLVVGLEG
jgi:hypothetical protein